MIIYQAHSGALSPQRQACVHSVRERMPWLYLLLSDEAVETELQFMWAAIGDGEFPSQLIGNDLMTRVTRSDWLRMWLLGTVAFAQWLDTDVEVYSSPIHEETREMWCAQTAGLADICWMYSGTQQQVFIDVLRRAIEERRFTMLQHVFQKTVPNYRVIPSDCFVHYGSPENDILRDEIHWHQERSRV